MTGRPLLLDLFCGAGGAAAGYRRAGFDVLGVDIKPQPHYRFEFMQADAVDALRYWKLDGFDAIHASPPCQAYTAYRRRGAGVGDSYPKLIESVRELLRSIGLPYVIENVPGAPLIDPVQLCGSSFDLDVRRHRLFESSLPLHGKRCDHDWQEPRFPPASNRINLRRTVEVGVRRIPLAVQHAAMGMAAGCMTLTELSQAVPPAYTEYIGKQLIDALERAA